MRVSLQSGAAQRHELPSIRVVRVAETQFGVISTAQLLACGLTRSTIRRWVLASRLHPVHRAVYAVGQRELRPESRLVATLLLAGPRAILSHMTAAWWWGLQSTPPAVVHVCSRDRRPGPREVRVHALGEREAARHRGMAITTVTQTLLDTASMLPVEHIRGLVREADFQRRLDIDAAFAACRRGHAGSVTLRAALHGYYPELADRQSELEERFLLLCERAGLPRPRVNPIVEGLKVDALWPAHRLVVELDGVKAHGTPARQENDHHRDLKLRTAGYTVLRYSWQQITRERAAVLADLTTQLADRTAVTPG